MTGFVYLQLILVVKTEKTHEKIQIPKSASIIDPSVYIYPNSILLLKELFQICCLSSFKYWAGQDENQGPPPRQYPQGSDKRTGLYTQRTKKGSNRRGRLPGTTTTPGATRKKPSHIENKDRNQGPSCKSKLLGFKIV